MLSRYIISALFFAVGACTPDDVDTYECADEHWDCPVCDSCPACPACPTVAKDACSVNDVVTTALDGTCFHEWCIDGEQTLVPREDGTPCVVLEPGGGFVSGTCSNGGCN